MTEVFENGTIVDRERDASMRTIGNISYGLHAIVAVAAVVPGANASIALLLIAFILDLVNKDNARGTWQESHFAWRIRTVLWAGVLYVLTSPLFLLFWVPGWIAWTAISVWFLYRIVRGWSALAARRAMPDA